MIANWKRSDPRGRLSLAEARLLVVGQVLRLAANGDAREARHTINRLELAGRYFRARGADVLLTREGVQPGPYLRGVSRKEAARRMLAAMGERRDTR